MAEIGRFGLTYHNPGVTSSGQVALRLVNGEQTLSAEVNDSELDDTIIGGRGEAVAEGQGATLTPDARTITGGQGAAFAEGKGATLSATSTAPTLLTAGQGEATAEGQGATLSAGANTITGGQGTATAEGQGATLSETGIAIGSTVSIESDEADAAFGDVTGDPGTTFTITCTLDSAALTPDSVAFYRDHVSESDLGSKLGDATQQSSTVWDFSSPFDIDDYDDVAAVVTYGAANTPSNNTISFSVVQVLGGQGTASAAGQGATLSSGAGAGTIVGGQGTATAEGQGATLSPDAITIVGGQGTATAEGQGATSMTPGAVTIVGGQGSATAEGQGATLTATSSFTSRWARGLNNDKARLSSTLTASHDFDGNTAVCMFRFIPQSLGGVTDYIVDWGFDASGNEGFAVRTDSSDRLVVRVGYTSGEYNLGPTSAMSTGTTYLCSVYIVDGTMYFRVNGTEIDNDSNGITDPSTYSTIRLFSRNNGGGDALQADLQKFLVLQGGYSGTPATALTEVRADIATYEALAATSELSGASFTGTVVQAVEMEESSDTSTSTTRADSSGNGNDFSDQYEDFGDQQWIASVDNSAL